MLETIVVGKTVQNVVVPAAIVTGVASATYIGYKAAKAAWGWTDDLIDESKEKYDEYMADPKRVVLKSGLEGGPLGPFGRGLKVIQWMLT